MLRILGSLSFGLLFRHYVNFATANFSFVDIDLAFRRSRDNTPILSVELGSVPRTLHCAAYQRAIRQRSALVCAVIAECDHALGTAADHYTLIANSHQHHLSFT